MKVLQRKREEYAGYVDQYFNNKDEDIHKDTFRNVNPNIKNVVKIDLFWQVFLRRGHQLYMAVCFWYLVKSYLSSVRVYSRVHWTNHFFSRCQKNTAMFI